MILKKSHLKYKSSPTIIKKRALIAILKNAIIKTINPYFIHITPLHIFIITVLTLTLTLKNTLKNQTLCQISSQNPLSVIYFESHPPKTATPLPYNHQHTLTNPKKRLHRNIFRGFFLFDHNTQTQTPQKIPSKLST